MEAKNRGLEKYYKIKCILRFTAAGMAFISAVLFSLAFFFDFEGKSQLFRSGSRLIFIAEFLTVIFCVIIVALTFIFVPKQEKEIPIFPTDAEYKPYYRVEPLPMKISRYFVAAVILSEGVVRAVLIINGGLKFSLSPFLSAVMLVLTVPLSLFFIPEIVNKLTPGYEKTHLICGTIGVLWFFLNTINIYFNYETALASPYRIIQQLTFIITLLMLVYEIKFHTDVPYVRARLAFLLSAFVLTCGFTFGRLVMLLSGKSVSADDTALIITFIGLSVYMGTKIFYYDED